MLFAHTKICTISFVRFLSLSIFKDLSLSLSKEVLSTSTLQVLSTSTYYLTTFSTPNFLFILALNSLRIFSFSRSSPSFSHRQSWTPPAGEEPGLATSELRPLSSFLRPAPHVVASVRCVAKVSSLAFLTFISRCGTTFCRSISRSTYDLLDERFPYSFISSSALRERERGLCWLVMENKERKWKSGSGSGVEGAIMRNYVRSRMSHFMLTVCTRLLFI